MDAELRERIEAEAERHALMNALLHEGSADVGAVMGPLMAENPAFREHGDAIAGVVAPVVAEVNTLDADTMRDRLTSIDPAAVAELETTDDTPDHSLPPLPNIEEYEQVRMRLAPNPNAPYHLGHARMPAVIGTYKERYDGWMLCRFDDTDPETKRPDLAAYDQILEDVAFLGFEPDEVLIASDRLELYYDHARTVIDAGGAYTCSCPAGEFSELKAAGEACPHRDTPIDTVNKEFEEMVEGVVSSGERVLRIRSELGHDNPAVRDWVAFRMVDTPHPRDEAKSYRCWPLLDFQSAIDDHLTAVTHIIRGIDLQDSAKRQRYVYDYLDWTYPEVVHWGRVKVDEYDVPLSASSIRELIEAGSLAGWDDPRAPTIASLRRRGIRGEAITAAMVELGTSTSSAELSMSWIYSNNRDLIDTEAPRVFLVREGRPFDLEGATSPAKVPVHPDHDDRGVRRLDPRDGVLLEPADVPALGESVWLKGLGCVVRGEDDILSLTDDGIEVVRDGSVDVIHWVPQGDTQPVELRRPTGTVTGLAEAGLSSHGTDTMVQFERIGFARIDEQTEQTVAYFAHR